MRLLQGALLGAALTIGSGLPAGAALAQDAGATIAVDEVHPAGASVHYIVTLTDADGEAVEGASITATPTSPAGADGPEATLSDSGDGVYEGPVEMATNGDWTVTFESTDPAATLELTQTIPVPADTDTDAADEDSNATLVRALIGLLFVAVSALVIWALTGRNKDDQPTK